jgi:conjugative transposon TraM protein
MATNQNNNRQKKFLLVIPLLILPFITLLFWSMGGGREKEQGAGNITGLNMAVPIAKLKSDSSENKLTLYQQAEKDSMKFRQAQKDDPYYKMDTAIAKIGQQDTLQKYDTGIANRSFGYSPGPGISSRSLSSSANTLRNNEQQINAKLAALTNQISQQQSPSSLTDKSDRNTSDSEVEQLGAKVRNINTTGAEDPQMNQLSNMLDKIQEIQNPGLVQRKLKEQSEKNRGQVFTVAAIKKDTPVSTFGGTDNLFQFTSQSSGFYSFDNSTLKEAQNAIEAVIHESQTVVNGSTVKLRLINDVFINGVLIPKDNFVFGMAALNGDRLTVKVSSIRYQRSIFPVELSVYDIDGVTGIYIPGAISRDVGKESADQSIQNLGFTSYDPSLGAQAASAGITAAKSLFSRKVRLVKVTVKAGYQVLLRDEKQKQID